MNSNIYHYTLKKPQYLPSSSINFEEFIIIPETQEQSAIDFQRNYTVAFSPSNRPIEINENYTHLQYHNNTNNIFNHRPSPPLPYSNVTYGYPGYSNNVTCTNYAQFIPKQEVNTPPYPVLPPIVGYRSSSRPELNRGISSSGIMKPQRANRNISFSSSK